MHPKLIKLQELMDFCQGPCIIAPYWAGVLRETRPYYNLRDTPVLKTISYNTKAGPFDPQWLDNECYFGAVTSSEGEHSYVTWTKI